MSSVTLQNIFKSYHHQNVLEQIDLSIKDGEFVTILGPSGCGKSTILRIITGLVESDQGDIFIDDEKVNDVEVKNRNVGMVFQQYALFPNLTVYDNIAFGLNLKKLSPQEVEKEVNYFISLVGLEDKKNHYPSQLSGGQQQRVALARALAVKPKVLLLDEPLSALDAQIRKKLQIQLRQIQQELKMTMILVTHDQEEAMTVSDRIIIMNKGRIEQIGTPTEIYTNPKSPFIANFIGNYNIFNRQAIESLLNTTFPERGDCFALRPELVHFGRLEGDIHLQSKVEAIVMKGSILAIHLEANGTRFHSELLHQKVKCAVGDVVDVSISASDVIHFQ